MGYNGIRFLQIANERKSRLSKRDSDDMEKNLTIFNNCTLEDRRTFNFNHYDRCTINNYYITIKKGEDDE
jgi:hypothetical protein